MSGMWNFAKRTAAVIVPVAMGINLTSGLPLPTTFLTDSSTVNNRPWRCSR